MTTKILDDPDAALDLLRSWTQWPVRADHQPLEVVVRSKTQEMHDIAVGQLESFIPNKFWYVTFSEDHFDDYWDYRIAVGVVGD